MQRIVIVANGAPTGANPYLTACGWPLRYESRKATWICVYS